MKWTPESIEQFSEAYRTGGVRAVQVIFPTLAYTSVQNYAYTWGVRRDKSPSTRVEPTTTTRQSTKSSYTREQQAAYREERGMPIPARIAPALVEVPEAAAKLPWVCYPRDPVVAERLAHILRDVRAVAVERGEDAAIVKWIDTEIAYVCGVAKIPVLAS